jgi:hypothetical protein
MSWWGERRKAQQNIELLVETPVDRLQVARAAMKLSAEMLSAIDAEIKEFKTRHGVQVDRLDQIVQARAASGCELAEIRREWFEISRRKGLALHDFHKHLHSWSVAVSAAREAAA